jgi:DNA repair protein RadC
MQPGLFGRDEPVERLLEKLPLRERPAWRVTYQAEGCSLIELLAVLIGGSSQIESAQELVGRFASLRSLLHATSEEIRGVRGIGPTTSARLRAALELGRRLGAENGDHRQPIQSPSEAAELLMHRMQHLEQEHLVVLPLNTRNQLIGEPMDVYHGSLNSSLVRIAEVFRPAIRANAAAILIAHNHPSGSPDPSPEDIALTRAIIEAGKLLDVECLDHLIIGSGRYVSLKSKGLGFE